MGRGATPATEQATRAGVEFSVHHYEASEAEIADVGYARSTAAALGADPAEVFKTLVADVDGALVVAVVPADSRLDVKALAAAVGGKQAALADQARAERSSGYVRGGISPLGQRKPLPTVVDETAELFDRIFVSAGRRGLQMHIAPADLVRLTGAAIADISR